MSQPQTENYSSDFNSRAVDVMFEAQRILFGEGFNITFYVTGVHGVYFDSKYVKNQLWGFLGGKPESSHTDVNHNANNDRWVSSLLSSGSR